MHANDPWNICYSNDSSVPLFMHNIMQCPDQHSALLMAHNFAQDTKQSPCPEAEHIAIERAHTKPGHHTNNDIILLTGGRRFAPHPCAMHLLNTPAPDYFLLHSQCIYKQRSIHTTHAHQPTYDPLITTIITMLHTHNPSNNTITSTLKHCKIYREPRNNILKDRHDRANFVQHYNDDFEDQSTLKSLYIAYTMTHEHLSQHERVKEIRRINADSSIPPHLPIPPNYIHPHVFPLHSKEDNNTHKKILKYIQQQRH